MDFHLKQWRNQHESEVEEEQQQPSSKIPKLLLDPSPPSSALPLFVPSADSSPTKLTSSLNYSNLSAVPTSRMGSYFSLAQWQELELQALIYRYMLAGAAIPTELLNPIKKSLLLHSSSASPASFFLQHYSNPYQPSALLQGGYWGRGTMDPEPGRCRRTDGKKWRCSRDVVAGQKYCERHVHRGRNRSRKPVEVTTAAVPSVIGGTGFNNCSTASPYGGSSARPPLSIPLASGVGRGGGGSFPSADLLHLSQRSGTEACNNRSDGGHVLRHFFDDWPRESEDSGAGHSSTCLTISMPATASDVSLKLATGNDGGEEEGGGSERAQAQINWATGWAGNHMGGPLAEAFRSSSSASNSSPTSVLGQLPRVTASAETSFVSA
ncbi:unnamed protein product [Linum tenue]|uniref:Growth-regulating factor n=2 Tax=Linum tenue TaxID=586396 RepID=A0AAV0JF44_9ROSI|nr:unnamed protein product [Linum tenue]